MDPAAGEPAQSVTVGGEIRRIAILTTELHPCACYLARGVRSSGAEIFLVNQRHPRMRTESPAHIRRLWTKRGFLIALDFSLLVVVKRLVRGSGRILNALRGRRRADGEVGVRPVPCFRPDPGIVREPWVTYVEVDDVNRGQDRDRLGSIRPDLILLAGAPILGRRAIELARVACINPHTGISPDYAGSSAFHWPVYEGRFEDIGFTVHLVVPRVDSGPILWQERMRWNPRVPLPRLTPLVAQRMYDRLIRIVLDLAAGKTLEAQPQRGSGRVRPPAGLYVKARAELRRMRYAARLAREGRD